MIYLIDDNQSNQRENLGIHFVDEGEFSDVLTSIEKLEKRAATDISHLAFLKNAKCILLHQNFNDYDKEKKEFLDNSRNQCHKYNK